MKNLTSLIVLVALTLAMLAENGQQLAVAATSTPTRTPTRTPTVTPTVTRTLVPAPTRTPLTTALRRQLVFGTESTDLRLFDGILPNCPLWKDLQSKAKLPYVYSVGMRFDIAQFCVYGIPSDNGVVVELTRPDGSQPEPASLRSEFQGTFSTLIQDSPYPDTVTGYSIPEEPAALTLYLWLAAGMPTGKWQLQVSNPDGDSVKASFQNKSNLPIPAIGLDKPKVGPVSKDASPFRLSGVNRDCTFFTRGSPVTIYAVNLAPATNYEIGVYLQNPDKDRQIDLVDKLKFKTNQKGNQQIDFTLPENYAPGFYRYLLPTVPGADFFWDVGPTLCLDVN